MDKTDIIKTVSVPAGKLRHYTVDRKQGRGERPDYYVVTEFKGDQRYKLVILGCDIEKIIDALKEASA